MAYHWQVLLFLLLKKEKKKREREKKRAIETASLLLIIISIYYLKVLVRVCIRQIGQNYNHASELILASVALTSYYRSISIDLLSLDGLLQL